MADTPGFAQLVPGFDFLQSLVKNAGSAMPNMGQWVAPTLSPEEIEKRIKELRTVQFWLEQNARLLAATIQALEVQRMTLSTLKNMNVQMGDLRDALKIHVPGSDSGPAATPPDDDDAPPPSSTQGKGESAPGAVDPMQWWGALTQQFTELAASALQEGVATAGKAVAATGDSLRAAAKKAPGTRFSPAAAKKTAAAKTVARPVAKKRAAPQR